MARPKTHPRPVVVSKLHFHKEVEDKECPLCIEALDDTDRDFYPCPCGYQVCLFCYQRLQNEYNNTCPGCRQQYSDDLDAVRKHIERKRQQQAAEAIARPTHGAGHSAHAHGSHGHGHAGSHAASGHAAHGHGHGHGGHPQGHAATAHRAKPGLAGAAASAAAAAASSAKQRPHHEAGHAVHARLNSHDPHAGSSLPAAANWVSANSLHSLSSVDDAVPPAAEDESAWPTLGAVAGNTPQPKQQHQDGSVRRRSSTGSVSSMHSQQQQQQPQQQQQSSSSRRHDPARSSCDSITSTVTEAQQLKQQGAAMQSSDEDEELQLQQQQQPTLEDNRTSSGFTTVEVTTFVGGARHSVCVPVTNHSDVPPFPEAVTLLEMLQQAVSVNKLSSTEAAVQLVQCLRKLEADSNQKQRSSWLQQALSHGSSHTSRINGLNGSLQRQSSNAAGAGRPPSAPAARAPPPGFGNAVPRTSVQSHLQQQELAAAARGMPYRPVSAGQLQQAGNDTASNNYASQSSMHSVDSNSSLFSQGSSLSQSLMWTESGLPGLDFGGSTVTGLATGMAAVPPRLQMLWAGTNAADSSSTLDSAAPSNGGVSNFAPTPPPGFGLSLAGGAGLSGSRLNGSYAPLSSGGLGSAAEGGGSLFQQQQQQQPIYRPWP